MDLDELTALMAASILGSRSSSIRVCDFNPTVIENAVKVAKLVWEETLKQAKEQNEK